MLMDHVIWLSSTHASEILLAHGPLVDGTDWLRATLCEPQRVEVVVPMPTGLFINRFVRPEGQLGLDAAAFEHPFEAPTALFR